MSDRTADRVTLLEEKKDWEKLQENPQFVKFCALIQAKLDTLQHKVFLQPAKSLDEMIAQNAWIGEAGGYLQVGMLIQNQLDAIDFELHNLGDSHEHEDD